MRLRQKLIQVQPERGNREMKRMKTNDVADLLAGLEGKDSRVAWWSLSVTECHCPLSGSTLL